MKVPTLPNDTMTNTLMTVSAELTLALEQYEEHLVHQTSSRMGSAALKLYDEIVAHLGEIPDDKDRGIREIITRGVVSVVTEANTCALIHERALGLTGEQAPAEIVKKSIGVLQDQLVYWSDV